MIVEIADGELALTDGPFELTDDIIRSLVDAERLTTVPLPPHPFQGTEVVAYCAADAAGRKPNCIVQGYDGIICGPMVIVGLDGDTHRFLTDEEAEVYTLEVIGPEFLPVLKVIDIQKED